MKEIHIEPITFQQLEQLQRIGIRTFVEAFASSNSQENMQAYLDQAFSIKKLQSELLDTNSEFYFAVYGDTEIGYLKLNSGPVQTEIQAGHTLEIERIYVLKACCQGKEKELHAYLLEEEIARRNQVHRLQGT